MPPRRSPEAVIERRRAAVMPLAEFSEGARNRIAHEVSREEPPPRWLTYGPADSPMPLAWIESRAWYEWHWARGIDPEGRRDTIPKRLREAVIARDGYVCQLCFEPVDPGDVHLDHIKPWSKGGRTVMSNLQVAHSRCNMRKGASYVASDQDHQA